MKSNLQTGNALNICEPFIRRPIATSLLMLAIAVFGMVAYFALPVNDLPSVEFPAIQVSAQLPGADPDTMSSAVATPLERQLSTISGLDSISSTNSLGSTSISLQFDLNRNIDSAYEDVQAAIGQVTSLLPTGMPSPPSVSKVNPANEPIMRLGLTSTTLPLSAMTAYGETVIAPSMSMVNGVASLNLLTDKKYAVRIQLDPGLMASNNIGLNEVENALHNWNVNLPVGHLEGEQQNYTLKASGLLTNAKNFRPLIISYRNGSPVRLEDLATVLDDVENNESELLVGGGGAGTLMHQVLLQVMRQPGSNTIRVRDGVVNALEKIKTQLPPSLDMKILGDRSQTIRGSFRDTQFTMLLTLALVVTVIFIFLRNASATLIPSLALPFSIIGTFAVIYLLGFSLNNLSLMALILAVGFVVDDAIVMLENIMRHIEMGEKPFEAALNGSQEIGFTIVSMTVSLAAVFIPVLFMGGILGRLFREFGVTICVSILISGVVSLSLTPMLASRFLRAHGEQKHGRFFKASESFFQKMLQIYDRSLKAVLRHRPAAMLVSLGILVATVFLFIHIPKGFMPDEDTNELNIATEAAQGVSTAKMRAYQLPISEFFAEDPNMRTFSAIISSNSNNGMYVLHLKPREERQMNVVQIAQYYRSKLSAMIPGLRIYTRIPPAVNLGTQTGNSAYLFTLLSANTDELYRQAQIFQQKVAGLPDLQDVSSNLQIKNPELHIETDRDKAAALKLTVQDVQNALSDAFSSRQIGTINAPDNQYKVLLEVKRDFQRDPNALSSLYLKSADGHLVPMSTVTKVSNAVGAQKINHVGQLPAVNISFNLKPGVSLSQGVAELEDLAKRELSDSITTSFQGAAKTFQDSQQNLLLLLFMAVLVIYIVLGILYESYLHPLTILAGLPSAGFGALLTLWLFHMDLNIYAFVGLIMLVGIVQKNAIMQIDFALEAERGKGYRPSEAIYQGCLVRFRPIMMTTMAALLGSLPLAFGYGQGGEARKPLGLTVVGGLLFSQLITLYLTPVVYTYLAGLQTRFQKHEEKVEEPEPSDRPVVSA